MTNVEGIIKMTKLESTVTPFSEAFVIASSS